MLSLILEGMIEKLERKVKTELWGVDNEGYRV